MRIQKRDSCVLGEDQVYCDVCDREIPSIADRRFCSTCGKDYCSNCPYCGNIAHSVVHYRGFPRVTGDRDVVSAHLDEYLEESFGSLRSVDDNVYLDGWLRSIQQVFDYFPTTTGGVDDLLPGSSVLAGKARKAAALLWVLQHGEGYIRDWVSLRKMGRFVDYRDRRAFAGRMPNMSTFVHSQGAMAPLKWKGQPMMKTTWDFALSAIMVQELRPKTIIELGTASGASAIWYADLQSAANLVPNVITLDRAQPQQSYKGVRFLQGDTQHIEHYLSEEILMDQPHPWLVFEDAHCNIGGILRYFDIFFVKGDYLLIEDVDAERELLPFLSDRESYKVDTRYTDYFGHNTTCAADQIFCRW
jgi:cephalosporin hydroxylase